MHKLSPTQLWSAAPRPHIFPCQHQQQQRLSVPRATRDGASEGACLVSGTQEAPSEGAFQDVPAWWRQVLHTVN